MNKARRKSLAEAQELLDRAQSIVEECSSDEQDYLDNIPENLQGSEKYEIAENAVECLDSALEQISDAIDNIESALE